ncbi:MAG TPA: response regulator [Phototrophicaceae bacterium]|jgi:two-component system cell cycle response regulator DivK|nr:response regulator [Phototrophicaceae bacterium]
MSKPVALVIDDDKNLSEVFSMALDHAGFETEIINDSTQAMEYITTRKPALITLDIQMPLISGIDILRWIRADEQLKHIKVLMVTANERASDTEEIDLMADLILIKPVTFSQLKEMAGRLIQTLPDQTLPDNS